MSTCDGEDLLQLYRDAFEALPEAIAIFDRDDRFVFWNGRFAEVYGEGLDLRAGTRFVDHLRASVAKGHVPSAAGREDEWLDERLTRFARGEGAHEHKLANGRWVRVQDRRLAHGGSIGIRADITEAMERESSLRLMFDENAVPMIVSDVNTQKVLAVNDAAVAFYGYPRDVFLTLRVSDYRPEDVPGEITDFNATRFVSGVPVGALAVHRTASGEKRIVHFAGRIIDHGGRPAILAAFFDQTEQRRMEEEVRRTHAFLAKVVDQVPTAMFVKDGENDNRFIIYNLASEALFGRPRAEVLGRTDHEIFGPEAAAHFAQQDQAARSLDSVETIEDGEVHRPDGSTRLIRTRKVGLAHQPGDAPRFVLGVSEDVTELRASEARMARMAHYDALTDLPNRFLFNDRLASALARRQNGELLAVLFLDLDGFKAVNDTHGHATGDELLRQVADRLRATLRNCDTAARFGGDEFAILQSIIAEPGEAAWLAAKLVATLAKPFDSVSRQLRIGASIGIALASSDSVDPSALLDHADAALYCAKREGKSTYRFATTISGDSADGRKAHQG